jgi:hypothetical protein
MQFCFLTIPGGRRTKSPSKAARKKGKPESGSDSLVDIEDDLAKATDGLVQMDAANEALSQTLSVDATSDDVKSGSSTEVVPCPPDVAPKSTQKPKGKLRNMW